MQTASKNTTGTFTDVEKEAMRNRAKELAAEAKSSKTRAGGEKDLLEAVSAMIGSDKIIATRIHELVTTAAPELFPKTWYGMPAYANKDGKVVCFFQAAQKFQSRYATFGFNDTAKIDDGDMWPTAFALLKLGKAEESKIVELVKKAVS